MQITGVDLLQRCKQDRRFDGAGRWHWAIGMHLGEAAVVEDQHVGAGLKILLRGRDGAPAGGEFRNFSGRLETTHHRLWVRLRCVVVLGRRLRFNGLGQLEPARQVEGLTLHLRGEPAQR